VRPLPARPTVTARVDELRVADRGANLSCGYLAAATSATLPATLGPRRWSRRASGIRLQQSSVGLHDGTCPFHRVVKLKIVRVAACVDRKVLGVACLRLPLSLPRFKYSCLPCLQNPMSSIRRAVYIVVSAGQGRG
jgi:hypothetical protein